MKKEVGSRIQRLEGCSAGRQGVQGGGWQLREKLAEWEGDL